MFIHDLIGKRFVNYFLLQPEHHKDRGIYKALFNMMKQKIDQFVSCSDNQWVKRFETHKNLLVHFTSTNNFTVFDVGYNETMGVINITQLQDISVNDAIKLDWFEIGELNYLYKIIAFHNKLNESREFQAYLELKKKFEPDFH